MANYFFATSDKIPISVIPSQSCLIQSLQSKANLSEQELMLQGYKSHLLAIQKSYLFYSFYQNPTQEYISFFTQSPMDDRPCTLDILLPLCIPKSKLVCIFLSQDKNYFCFYQDSALVFYKEFQNDFQTYLKQIQILFSHQTDKIYCLCHEDKHLKTLQAKYNILPLLSLFDQNLDFHLSSIHSPITLHSFHNLNPKLQKTQKLQSKTFGIALIVSVIILSALLLGTNFYLSHLNTTLDDLHQNISSRLPTSSVEDFKSLDSENQILLSSLYEFSQLDEQQLLILDRLLLHLNPDDIIAIKLEHSIILHLQNSPNLTAILSSANSLGYRCKISKEQEMTILEISKL